MKEGWLWVPRLLAAGILLPMGYQKLIGGEMSRMLFDTLGMEPHGRVVIGLVEILAALLLLSPQAAAGALLAVGVMLGAIIAHSTALGMEVEGDGGRLLTMLVVVFLSSATVLLLRRGELPIIGSTLEGEGKDWLP